MQRTPNQNRENADVRQRGRFTGIWLGLRELGQLIGSSIQLSLNSKAGQKGAVGYSTYLVLIALQCLGLPLALLVSPPEKVIRPDGTRLPNIRNWTSLTLKEQFKKWWQLLKRKANFLVKLGNFLCLVVLEKPQVCKGFICPGANFA